MKNRKHIDADDTKRAAAMLRSRMIANLDKCFLPSHPLGRLISDCREGLRESGYTEVDFMQAVQLALFPEEFLPEAETDELIRLARNQKHQDIAGVLPGSARMSASRIDAFMKLTWGIERTKAA